MRRVLDCSRREPATRLVGLEAKNFVPQQQAWYLLTGGGWFSCSWKLHEGRMERCRASGVCGLAAVDMLGEICEVLMESSRERKQA